MLRRAPGQADGLPVRIPLGLLPSNLERRRDRRPVGNVLVAVPVDDDATRAQLGCQDLIVTVAQLRHRHRPPARVSLSLVVVTGHCREYGARRVRAVRAVGDGMIPISDRIAIREGAIAAAAGTHHVRQQGIRGTPQGVIARHQQSPPGLQVLLQGIMFLLGGLPAQTIPRGIPHHRRVTAQECIVRGIDALCAIPVIVDYVIGQPHPIQDACDGPQLRLIRDQGHVPGPAVAHHREVKAVAPRPAVAGRDIHVKVDHVAVGRAGADLKVKVVQVRPHPTAGDGAIVRTGVKEERHVRIAGAEGAIDVRGRVRTLVVQIHVQLDRLPRIHHSVAVPDAVARGIIVDHMPIVDQRPHVARPAAPKGPAYQGIPLRPHRHVAAHYLHLPRTGRG